MKTKHYEINALYYTHYYNINEYSLIQYLKTDNKKLK